MAEIKINKGNYQSEILNSELPVLIDLWAEWCGPCKMLGPIISEIADEYKGKLKVGKINVDEEQELAAAFGVSSIPLLVIMKNGKITASSLGYIPKEKVKEFIDKNI